MAYIMEYCINVKILESMENVGLNYRRFKLVIEDL